MTELKLRANVAAAAVTGVSDGQCSTAISESNLDVVANGPFASFVLEVLLQVSLLRVFHGIDKVSPATVVILWMVHGDDSLTLHV